MQPLPFRSRRLPSIFQPFHARCAFHPCPTRGTLTARTARPRLLLLFSLCRVSWAGSPALGAPRPPGRDRPGPPRPALIGTGAHPGRDRRGAHVPAAWHGRYSSAVFITAATSPPAAARALHSARAGSPKPVPRHGGTDPSQWPTVLHSCLAPHGKEPGGRLADHRPSDRPRDSMFCVMVVGPGQGVTRPISWPRWPGVFHIT
jgi:hypothetical protein